MQGRLWIVIAGFLGALSVATGAYVSHGLPTYLTQQQLAPAVIAERIETAEIAVRYQMVHAVVLLVVGVLVMHYRSRLLRVSGIVLLIGLCLFTGMLYYIALTGDRSLGRVAAIGGSTMIGGWILLGLSGPLLQIRSDED